jgi:hypothetical protein
MSSRQSFAVIALLSGSLLAAGAQELAPGWTELSYKAPEPGTYQLPTLGLACDGDVLDDDGDSQRLLDLRKTKSLLLAFFTVVAAISMAAPSPPLSSPGSQHA